MKKSLYNWWLALLMIIMTIIFSYIQWRYPLPLGKVGVVELGEVFSLIALLSLGFDKGSVTIIASSVLLALLGTSNWITIIAVLIDALFVAAVVGWRLPLTVHLSTDQALALGLIIALVNLVAAVSLTVGWGYLLSQNEAITVAFGKQALAPNLLVSLLYALLIPIGTLGLRRFTEHVDKPRGPHGSVEINLMAQDHRSTDKKDKKDE